MIFNIPEVQKQQGFPFGIGSTLASTSLLPDSVSPCKVPFGHVGDSCSGVANPVMHPRVLFDIDWGRQPDVELFATQFLLLRYERQDLASVVFSAWSKAVHPELKISCDPNLTGEMADAIEIPSNHGDVIVLSCICVAKDNDTFISWLKDRLKSAGKDEDLGIPEEILEKAQEYRSQTSKSQQMRDYTIATPRLVGTLAQAYQAERLIVITKRFFGHPAMVKMIQAGTDELIEKIEETHDQELANLRSKHAKELEKVGTEFATSRKECNEQKQQISTFEVERLDLKFEITKKKRQMTALSQKAECDNNTRTEQLQNAVSQMLTLKKELEDSVSNLAAAQKQVETLQSQQNQNKLLLAKIAELEKQSSVVPTKQHQQEIPSQPSFPFGSAATSSKDGGDSNNAKALNTVFVRQPLPAELVIELSKSPLVVQCRVGADCSHVEFTDPKCAEAARVQLVARGFAAKVQQNRSPVKSAKQRARGNSSSSSDGDVQNRRAAGVSNLSLNAVTPKNSKSAPRRPRQYQEECPGGEGDWWPIQHEHVHRHEHVYVLDLEEDEEYEYEETDIGWQRSEW